MLVQPEKVLLIDRLNLIRQLERVLVGEELDHLLRHEHVAGEHGHLPRLVERYRREMPT